MRRWFVLLLVLLMPLRGWVGDAVAGQAIGHQLALVHVAGAPPASMPADCPGHHATAAQSDASADDGTPAATAGMCSQCQLCAGIACLAPAGPAPAGVLPAHPAPVAGSSRFASTAPQPLLRPPRA